MTEAEFTPAQADAITAAVRSAAERSGHVTTDPFKAGLAVLMAGMTRVRLVHLLELRKSLEAVFASAGQAAPGWTDAAPAAGATPIMAVHLMELRAAVTALE